MTAPRTCNQCAHFEPNRCRHYQTKTVPDLDCRACPAFERRQYRAPKIRPKTATPAGVCRTCRHWPGAADLLCREANRHASARSCRHYALPVNVVPLAPPPKRRRKWSRVLPK